MTVKCEDIGVRLQRFVQRDENGCWLFMGFRDPKGYGLFSIRGKTIRATRAAWQYYRGPIPEGMAVLHHCDNPPCINPDHLFLGTHLENSRDKIAKGRQVVLRGSALRHAKLTEDDVRAIRSDTRPYRVIAEQYGVTYHTISSVKRRRQWQHVA